MQGHLFANQNSAVDYTNVSNCIITAKTDILSGEIDIPKRGIEVAGAMAALAAIFSGKPF